MPGSAHPSARSPLAGATAPVAIWRQIAPITIIMFLGCLCVGIPLPVLPLQIHHELGFGTLVVGIVIGIQSAAALLTRAFSGNLTDTRGAKHAVRVGLLIAALAGACYLAAYGVKGTPKFSLGILLIGRVLLGCAESLLATGTLTLTIGIVGLPHAGKAMAWIGVAIYGALATGGPIGMALNQAYGFASVAISAIVLPLMALLLLRRVVAMPHSPGTQLPFYKVLRLVLVPGIGLALATMGFGAIATFMTLLFVSRGWDGSGLALSMYGGAYIGARLLLGGIPDKFGGARVAFLCLLVEGSGQLLIWTSSAPHIALLGAVLSGAGFSLVFPAFGIETIKRASVQNRGAALAAYAAFFDIGLVLAGPAAGALAADIGYAAVFACSAIAIAGALLIAACLAVERASATS